MTTLSITRRCLRCGADLTDVMDCYVFVAGKPVPGALLCVEHGKNGHNGVSQATYDYLTRGDALADEIAAALLSRAAAGGDPDGALDAAETYLAGTRLKESRCP